MWEVTDRYWVAAVVGLAVVLVLRPLAQRRDQHRAERRTAEEARKDRRLLEH